MNYAKGRDRRVVIFTLFILIPISVSFLAPAIAYQWPLRINSLETGLDVVITLQDDALLGAIGFYGLWILVFAVTVWGLCWLLDRMSKRSVSFHKSNLGDTDPKILGQLFILTSVVGAIISVVHCLIEFPTTLEPIIHQLAFLPICATALGIYLASQFRREFSRSQWSLGVFLFVGAITCGILPHLLAGRAAPIGYGMLCFIFLSALFRSRMMVPLIGVAVVATVMAMAIKSEIRFIAFAGGAGFERIHVSKLWREGWEALSKQLKEPPKQYVVSERVAAFLESDPNYRYIRWMESDGESLLKFSVARVLHRVNHLSTFAYVIEKTPSVIPHSGMHTYLPVLFTGIPRALMPLKPANESGQYFGHRYHLIWPEDKRTAINLSIVIEGYMSAGFWGVVASATLFAIFCTVVWIGIVEKMGVLGIVFIGATLFMNVANSESGFALIVGGGIHAVLIYGFLLLVFRFLMTVGSQKKSLGPVYGRG
jgi:hypothetical protein